MERKRKREVGVRGEGGVKEGDGRGEMEKGEGRVEGGREREDGRGEMEEGGGEMEEGREREIKKFSLLCHTLYF